MNKKALAVMSSWPFWMLFIIMIGIAAIILVSIGTYFVDVSATVPENAEILTIISSFYNSENCFTYTDTSIHPHVIDLEKFNQKTMNQCYSDEKANFAFLLTLVTPEKELTVQSTQWSKSDTKKQLTENVLVRSGEKTYHAKLKIDIKNVQ